MADQGGAGVSSEIQTVRHEVAFVRQELNEIAFVRQELKGVTLKIDDVEAKIKECKDPKEKEFLWKKEGQLRDEMKQLRDKEARLQEEKLILLRQSVGAGGASAGAGGAGAGVEAAISTLQLESPVMGLPSGYRGALEAYSERGGDGAIVRRSTHLAKLNVVRRSVWDQELWGDLWRKKQELLPPEDSFESLMVPRTKIPWWTFSNIGIPESYPKCLQQTTDEKSLLLWSACFEELQQHRLDSFSQPEAPLHFLWFRLARLFFMHVEPDLMVSLEWDPHRQDGMGKQGMTAFPSERPVDFVVRWNDPDRRWPLLFCEVSSEAVKDHEDHKDYSKMTYQMAYSLHLQLATYQRHMPQCFGLFIGGFVAEPVALKSFHGTPTPSPMHAVFSEMERVDISPGRETIGTRVAQLFAFFGLVVDYAREVKTRQCAVVHPGGPLFPTFDEAPQSRPSHGSNTPAKKDGHKEVATKGDTHPSPKSLAMGMALSSKLNVQRIAFENDKTVVLTALTRSDTPQRVAVVAKMAPPRELDLLKIVSRGDTQHVALPLGWMRSSCGYAMILDWCDAGPDDADAARACLHHGLAALKHLHSHGVLHRDVKPANLLFHRRTSQWKLLDLDCSVVAGAEMSVGVVEGELPVGTDGFLAPELLRPNGEYTIASDIWGLGMTLRRKFTELPDDVKAAAHRMTADDPNQRMERCVDSATSLMETPMPKGWDSEHKVKCSTSRHPLQELSLNSRF